VTRSLVTGVTVYVIVAPLSALPAGPDNHAPAGPPSSTTLADTSTQRTLESLRAEITELRRKVEKPPKDAWDKLTSASGLGSGLAVALIGFYATSVYNRRQRESEERRRDQEVLVSQIQTVEKFIPHLSSPNESVKRGALISISALGNEELAVKLATAFGGLGAAAALKSIASTAGAQEAASAEHALELVLRSISSNALDHLRLLRDHTKGPTEHYFIPYNNETGLCGELNLLKILGYIQFKGHNNINGVEDLPRGNQTVGVLYDTIDVTDTGRKFLELYDKLAENPNLSDQR
jgi:hypothetical protein